MAMSAEQILEALAAIMEAAVAEDGEERPLTDDEAARYEALEQELAVLHRTEEIKKRDAAYRTARHPGIHTGVAQHDDTLDRAFDAYMRTGKANQDLVELRAQSEGVGTEGGFLVPDGFRQKLVEARLAFGGLSDHVDTFSTTTGQPIEYPTLNDTANQGGITPEGAAFVDGADLVFGTVTLGAYKYTSTGAGTTTPLRVSVELLQDAAFDVQGLVSRALGTRIARAQAVDWILGSGVGEPQGVFQPAANQNVDVADVLDYEDLIDLEAALDPEYESNARWLMSKGTWVVVRKIVDADERPLIQANASAGIGTRVEMTLLGYPVIIDQAATTFGSATGPSTNLALGDWREAYALRRVANLTVVVNPYTRANNGQVEFTAWERADAVVQNRAAYVSLANL